MRGYADAKQILERSNMTVGTWDSLGKDNLPADADLIIVGGPRTAFLEPEAGALEKYLAAGGHALLLLDPILPGPGAPPLDLGFGGLLGKYGIKLGNDLVVDPANALPTIGAETRARQPVWNEPDRQRPLGRRASGRLPLASGPSRRRKSRPRA